MVSRFLLLIAQPALIMRIQSMTPMSVNMPSHDKALAAAASAAASFMLVRSVVNELLPDELRDMLRSGVGRLRSHMSSQHTITIERKADTFTYNHVFEAVKTYLAEHINTKTQQHLCVSSMDEDEKMVVTMAEGEEMTDLYDGTEFKWCLNYRYISSSDSDDGGGGNGKRLEAHSFVVTFHRKHKEKALNSYLPFIVATAKAIRQQERTIQIYMYECLDVWSPMDLHHPSTFDTLAMDHKMKQSIIDDLNRFIKRKDYYKRIGKAWKRGYLLYGPPGTGKSSLIAAMANYLRFDIYDLELTAVESNSYFRRLLGRVSNRSILVVEDIDCTIKFVDGLWSAGGEERIIVFTTNYKERLDPALLRAGRMDMHIYMGYCTPESFRILANNYHLIDYHAMFPEIEKLIKEVTVTPAEVAEVLMRKDDVDVALHDLVDLLKSKLPHVVATAKAMTDQHRNLKMHMVEYDAWTAVDLRHPSTFDTIAMDTQLLYGPPGTGKSSLIAAMANYLKFDIYDLELTEVKCNSDLRRLLVGMSNRSILVVEDIDCSIELQQREEGERRARSSSMVLGIY